MAARHRVGGSQLATAVMHRGPSAARDAEPTPEVRFVHAGDGRRRHVIPGGAAERRRSGRQRLRQSDAARLEHTVHGGDEFGVAARRTACRVSSESAPQEVRGIPVACVVTHGVKVSSAVDEQVIFDQPAA